MDQPAIGKVLKDNGDKITNNRTVILPTEDKSINQNKPVNLDNIRVYTSLESYKTYSEKELLGRLANNDHKAFEEIFNSHWKNVYGHALAYAKSRVLAEEISQDVFFKLWKNRERLADVTDFDSYLFILGKHHIISALRRKLEETFPLLDDDILREDEWVPGRQLELKQANAWLLNAIESLPPVRRKVFKMSRFENKTHEEIAKELGVARNTVKQHIVLALNSLRATAHCYPELYLFLSVLLFQNKF